MVFKIPRPVWTQAIVDKAGLATKAFSRRIEEAFGKIETQETSQDAALVLIQQVQADQAAQLALLQATQQQANAAQQTANDAQATADAAGGGTARSGSASFTDTISGAAWVIGPTINLTGVVAGNLTITGTAPTSGALISGNFVAGEYRVVEMAGGTTLFTGSMTINDTGVTDNSVAAVAAFTVAEITTGAVSYRIDIRRSGGTVGGEADVSMYFYARRS